jgi:flagellar biosynthesis protein
LNTPKKQSRKKAVALRYDRGKDPAPTVVGKGLGILAEKIIELAKEHNIPVHEDSDLVDILAKLDLYEEIPPSTYIVVAEILAFVYKANNDYK